MNDHELEQRSGTLLIHGAELIGQTDHDPGPPIANEERNYGRIRRASASFVRDGTRERRQPVTFRWPFAHK